MAKTTTTKLLIHRHAFGVSTSLCKGIGFKNEDFVLTEEQAIKLAKLCGLDFEPDKGEELDIVDLEENYTVVLRKELYGE